MSADLRSCSIPWVDVIYDHTFIRWGVVTSTLEDVDISDIWGWIISGIDCLIYVLQTGMLLFNSHADTHVYCNQFYDSHGKLWTRRKYTSNNCNHPY
jgi:hypothetical protein